ncbi:MAG: tyrosine-type recombinase/integrase [Lachnospiraceae bacterium]|nr:tyrosine-type recombinase/integrase [Lachnospiraceae bacterium]
MQNLKTMIDNYLLFCESQKRLDAKTQKAYRIDLEQFSDFIKADSLSLITPAILEDYITTLHKSYKPKTVKRKIASVKAFFHFLEYKDLLLINPFNKVQVKFREPVLLPKTIPLHIIENLLSTMYSHQKTAKNPYQQKCILRDISVVELLLATGMRISELCSLKPEDVNLYERVILIYGKGAKERKIQIGNDDVASLLLNYQKTFFPEIKESGYFFVNRQKKRLSEQSVRDMIKKYCHLASIDMHITPHMFRHSFATCLLEADVDIRYIQEMLGHSSINITEIYTHVAMSKQKDILTSKHPRKYFRV